MPHLKFEVDESDFEDLDVERQEVFTFNQYMFYNMKIDP